MAFLHGKSTKVFINGYDLSAYFKGSTISGKADTAETTCYGGTAKAYIAGLKDATIKLEGLFEATANGIVDTLHAALGQDNGIFSIFPDGDAIGKIGFCSKGTEPSYEVDSPVADVVSVSAEVQSSVGAEMVLSHHAMGAATVDGNGSAVDGAASSANGGVGYLHVSAFSGLTNLIVTIEDSADGATGWATILTFATVTAVTKERVAITGTVRRYTRAVTNVTGTGSVTFSASFGRK